MEPAIDAGPSRQKPFQPKHPISSSISLSTFRKLPVGVQMDYAQFHGIDEPAGLTADDISRALFKETEWIPAENIEGHVGIVTDEGVVVGKEVMDLVEWLIAHGHDGMLPNAWLPSPAAHTYTETGANGYTRPSDIGTIQDKERGHENLQHIADNLRKSYERLKVAVAESRKAVRDVCAEVFVLRNQLDVENAYQSTVTNSMAKIVGFDVLKSFGKTDNLPSSDAHPNMVRAGRKRPRSVTSFHVMYMDSPHRSKRRRLDEAAPFPPQQPVVPQTILNYTSDDDDSDDTYSDSNGTDWDFIDDPYEYYDSHGRSPYTALRAWNYGSDSPDDESDKPSSQSGILWNNIADFGDGCDPDYAPPEGWDLEDIWEIDHAPREYAGGTHPLFDLNFADELNDCGGILSDCGLSTDDSEAGYHELGVLQRPSWDSALVDRRRRFSASLGDLLEPLSKYYDDRPQMHWPEIMSPEELTERLKQQRSLAKRRSGWFSVKGNLQCNMFPPLNLDIRLRDVLESDQSLFYFDDDEWGRFEEDLLSLRRVVP